MSSGTLFIQELSGAGSNLATSSSAATASSWTSVLQRFSFTATLGNASTAYIRCGFNIGVTNGLPVDITIRVGWPQVELGAFASSPIRTTSAAVTRPADAITGPSALVSVLAGSTGWCYADVGPSIASTAAGIIGYNAGGRGVIVKNAGNTAGTTLNGAGTALNTANTGTFTGPSNRIALTWSGAGRTISLNGGTVATDANTVEAVTAVLLGALSSGSYLNGPIRRIAAGTATLTSAELRAITA